MATKDLVWVNTRRGDYSMPFPELITDGNCPTQVTARDCHNTSLRGTLMYDVNSSNKKGDSYNFAWASNSITIVNQNNLYWATSAGNGFGFKTDTLPNEQGAIFYGVPDTNKESKEHSKGCRYMRDAIGVQCKWGAPHNSDSSKTEEMRLQDFGPIYNRPNDNNIYYAPLIHAGGWASGVVKSIANKDPTSGHAGNPTDHAGSFNAQVPQSVVNDIRAAQFYKPYYLVGFYFATDTDKDGVKRKKGMCFYNFKILTDTSSEQHGENFRYVVPGVTVWNDLNGGFYPTSTRYT